MFDNVFQDVDGNFIRFEHIETIDGRRTSTQRQSPSEQLQEFVEDAMLPKSDKPPINQLVVQRRFKNEKGEDAVHFTVFLRLRISMRGHGVHFVLLHLDCNEISPECSNTRVFRMKWRLRNVEEINWEKFDDCSKIHIYKLKSDHRSGAESVALSPEKLGSKLKSWVDPCENSEADNSLGDHVEGDISMPMSDRGKLSREVSKRSHKSHLSTHKKRRRVHEPSDRDQSGGDVDQSSVDEDLVESDEDEEGTLNFGFGEDCKCQHYPN